MKAGPTDSLHPEYPAEHPTGNPLSQPHLVRRSGCA
jgi:hypothetical protein